MASQETSKPALPKKSVGPEYLSSESKPEATVSTAIEFSNVHVLKQTPQLIALLT